MKKRLRKKLHRGEFTEYGFGIDIEFLGPRRTPDEVEGLMNTICDVLCGAGFSFGGGGSDKGFGCFVTRYKKTCTEADRQLARSVLMDIPGLSIVVGSLEDAWR